MFAVTVSFRVRPECVAAFLPLMHENARNSLAAEPGCRVFDVCTDPGRPGEVFLYELYESPAAFGAHLDSAHFSAFDAEVAPMVIEKSVVTFAEVTR